MLPLPATTDCGYYSSSAGILVTADSVSIYDTTYATSQITSVTVRRDWSAQVTGWFLVAIGLILLLVEGPNPVGVLDVICLTLFLLIGLIPALSGKSYNVVVTTAARERGVYGISDKGYAKMVAGAVASAMIASARLQRGARVLD